MRLSSTIQFGDFQFDPSVPLLTRGTRSVELAPKALQILNALVNNAGRVVSKDDLLRLVWHGTMVEEGNLAVHISALRKALGGDALYIETVPKRGYRFAALVHSSLNPPHDPCRIAEHHLQQQTAGACRRAAALLRECLLADPHNAQAKAGLANTLLFRFVLGDLSRSDAVLPARILLDEAGQIDPASAAIHLSRSRYFALAAWQWERSQDELHRALELAGTDNMRHIVTAWQGSYLVQQGEFESGLRQLRSACGATPLSPFIARLFAEAHLLARDFFGCVSVSRDALQLHPHCWLLYRSMGRALTALGEYAEAARSFERAMFLYDAPQPELLADLAYLDAVAGNRRRATDRLHRLESSSLVSRAQIHAALGNKHGALDCLEQACANGDWSLAGLRQDYRLDPLRSSPRFRTVLARVGI